MRQHILRAHKRSEAKGDKSTKSICHPWPSSPSWCLFRHRQFPLIICVPRAIHVPRNFLRRFFFSFRCLRPDGTFVTIFFYSRAISFSHAHADQCKREEPYACKSVFWLEFHRSVNRVVDQGKASRLATTELSSEAECEDGVLVGLVHGSELFVHLIFAQVGQIGV